MKIGKRIVRMLALSCFTAGLLSGAMTLAEAADTADTDKAIMFGTSGISSPAEEIKEEYFIVMKHYIPRDYIYFGIDGGTPIKWRVLDADKANDGETSGMFLMSEYLLGNKIVFGSNEYYQGSPAQEWCIEFSGNASNFSQMEQKLMKGVAKIEEKKYLFSFTWNKSELTDKDKMFLPSAQELAEYVADYSKAPGLEAAFAHSPQNGERWWLRSPGTTLNVGTVHEDGLVGLWDVGISKEYALRPAFNLDSKSVLFTSTARGGKPSDVSTDGIPEIKNADSNEWKLTLKDSGRDASFQAKIKDGDAATITYSGAKTGNDEYISAIIQNNSTKEYTHYGKLKKLSDSQDAAGELNLDLGDVVFTSNETLYVLNEQCNSDERTDYANEPVAVDFPKNAYVITNQLTNMTTDSTETYHRVDDSAPYTATLKADNGYVLPEKIEVSAGDQELTEETDYTYRNGKLEIPAAKIRGDIVIKANGTAGTYSVAVTDGNGDFGEAHAGYKDAPAARELTITNTGSMEVTGIAAKLEGTGKDDFTLTQPVKKSLAPKETTTLTVRPQEGRAAGSYTADIKITGSNQAEEIVQVSFKVSGHKYTKYISDGNTTCTEDGTKTAGCDYKDCPVTDTQPEKAFGHQYEEKVTPPTCTEGGYTTYTCIRGDITYRDNETSATGHSYGAWVTVDAPTCEGEGQEQRECSVCHVKETRNLKPAGHTWETDYTIDQKASCTKDGSESIHCQKCDATKDSKVIPATGHTPGKAATCTTDQTCTVCGEVLTERLGHTGGEATCTNKAEKEKTGSKDGANGESGKAVKTGDSADAVVFTGLLFGSVLSLAAVFYLRRKQGRIE